MSLEDAIEKLTKAEKLLKPSSWLSQSKRDAKAVSLVNEVLADSELSKSVRLVVQRSQDRLAQIAKAKPSASSARTFALLSLTETIIFIRNEILLNKAKKK